MSEPLVTKTLQILVVDDEINVRKTLAMSLESDGNLVVAVSNARDARDEASRHMFGQAFVDLRLGLDSGLDLIQDLQTISPWMKIVIITAHGSIDSAVETMKRGAADYLTKPFTPAQVRLVSQRLAQLRTLEEKVAGLESIVDAPNARISLQSNNPAMQRVIALAQQVAANDVTLLIRGESGTGKGVLARAIHSWSLRKGKVFSTVSCPALSPQLLESELFGHVKGAFTGAVQDSPGRIASADGGTLFLDEIGDLPVELQPKLLRFVQDREYERVGNPVTRRADVRVIAATNVDLEQAVLSGKFREDLLYRIKVVQIDIPPLRDRPEDVITLAENFLLVLGRGKGIVGFTDGVIGALTNYSWPGNVRELQNVVERAVILCRHDRVGMECLPANFSDKMETPEQIGDRISLDKLEEMHIRRILAQARSLEEAARILGIDVATLWRRRRKYGI